MSLMPHVNHLPMQGRYGIRAGQSFLGVIMVVWLAASGSSAAAQKLSAFPGAEGFGALATGGRNGTVVRVTSLADNGPGTFREAVSQPDRLVTFAVGGNIRLESNLRCSSDLTILGQTAPGGGIGLYGRSVSFSDCSNVIVRYVRFREGIGGDRGRCAVNLAHGADMIFDHVSIEWGRWDCLGVTEGSHDLTFQNCIIGQGIAPQRFGALVDSVTNVTFSHNLWIDNESRNPKAKGTIQYINNVVYDWGGDGLVGGHSLAVHHLDVIGNYFIKGPASNDRFSGMFTATDHVFQRANMVDLNRGGSLNGRRLAAADFGEPGKAPTFADAPWLKPSIPVSVDSAAEALRKVAAGAGCSLRRDWIDEQLVAELESFGSRGRIISSEVEIEGLNRGGGAAFRSGAAAGERPADRPRPDANTAKSTSAFRSHASQPGYVKVELDADALAGGQ